MKIPKTITSLADSVNAHNAQFYLVGGASRHLLDKTYPLNDYDCVVFGLRFDKLHGLVKELVPNCSIGNQKYPFISFTDKESGLQVEITVPRFADSEVENPYCSLEQDAKRRALTIDAVYYNVATKEFKLPIDNSDVHVTHRMAVPCDVDMFLSDPRRIIISARKCANLSLDPSFNNLRVQITQTHLDSIPHEVIGENVLKALRINFRHFIQCLHRMDALSLVEWFRPTIGFKQNNSHHNEFLHSHIIWTIENLSITEESDAMLLAGLFHDISKPSCFQVKDDGSYSYHGHEEKSEEIARELMTQWGFSTSLIEHVCELVRLHMQLHNLERNGVSKRSVRRLLAKLTHATLEELMTLAEADNAAKSPSKYYHGAVSQIEEMIDNDELDPREEPHNFVNGRDFLAINPDLPRDKSLGELIKLANEMHIESQFTSPAEAANYVLKLTEE